MNFEVRKDLMLEAVGSTTASESWFCFSDAILFSLISNSLKNS